MKKKSRTLPDKWMLPPEWAPDFDPDDELIIPTPPDVVDAIGFDPLEFATKAEKKEIAERAKKGRKP